MEEPIIEVPRLPDESDSDYSLLLIYIKLTRPRKIKDMPDLIQDNPRLSKINYSTQHLEDISRKNNWKERAAQYDVTLEQHLLAKQQQHEIQKATTFPEKEDKTINLIDKLKEQTLKTLNTNTTLKPYEIRNIASATEVIVKCERLINNQSTENQNQHTNAEIQTRQEQTIEITQTETLLNDEFMNKQIEYGLKLIRKLEQ